MPAETQRGVQTLEEVAGKMSKRRRWQGYTQERAKRVRRLMQHTWAEGPSLVKYLGDEDDSVMATMYSVSKCKYLRRLYVRLSRTLES